MWNDITPRRERRGILSRVPRPTLTGVIAIMALLLSVSGGAIAKSTDKDEVFVSVVTGGPVTNTGPGEEDEGSTSTEIPLSNATFTQQPGQVLLISAVADISGIDQPTAHCDTEVNVTADGAMDELFLNMFLLARRGDPGMLADSDALTAPAEARELTLQAEVVQNKVDLNEDGEGEPEVQDCSDEEATASVRLSVVTLQD